MNAHEEYEKIEVMIDSGASENSSTIGEGRVVPNREDSGIRHNRTRQQLGSKQRTSSTLVRSSSESSTTTVRRVGLRFQMCRGLGQEKILGTVSRLFESRHSLVLRDPEQMSYIQNNSNGYRTYLRQQNGSYNVDLRVTIGQGGGGGRQSRGLWCV